MRGVASRNRGGQNSSITRRLASAHRPSQRGAVAFTGVLASSASAQAHATASPKQLIRETYLSSGANCGVDRTRNLLSFLQILLPDQADNSRTVTASSCCGMRLRGALGSTGDGPRAPQLLWMAEIARPRYFHVLAAFSHAISRCAPSPTLRLRISRTSNELSPGCRKHDLAGPSLVWDRFSPSTRYRSERESECNRTRRPWRRQIWLCLV